jgi:two-component system LytT family response regulator
MKINLLIADDELSGRSTLELLVRKELSNGEKIQIDIVANLEDVVKSIKENSYELIFLDINFKGKSSFDIVELIPKSTKIVFVTAYAEHVIKALRSNAFDYLLKPVKQEELSNCLKRYFDNRQVSDRSEILQIREKGFNRRIQIKEISHIKGQGPYAHIFVNNEQITVARTLKSILPELGNNFIRIHKSYLVNREFIKAFQYNQLILTNKICLPVSRNGIKNLDV